MLGTHEYLCDAHPEWGRVVILPVDTEIFGFGVADLQIGEVRPIFDSRTRFAEALRRWTDQNAVELVGCSVPADESAWRALLPHLHFHYVDTVLSYAVPKLQAWRFDRRRPGVRLATKADRAAVELIAERGFKAGRYHADPLFPRELANRRFRRFVEQTFASLSEDNRVYVTDRDPVTCFMHTRLHGDTGEIVLGGTDPAAQGTVVPLTVWLGALMDLKRSGIRRLVSKVSAGNTAMINIATYAGARFSEARHVFHWHAERAPHLQRLEALFSANS